MQVYHGLKSLPPIGAAGIVHLDCERYSHLDIGWTMEGFLSREGDFQLFL